MITLAALAGAGVLLAGSFRGPPCTVLHDAKGGVLSVAIANLSLGTARVFCFGDNAGSKLRFVLARDSDGKVHAVFDACHQCYKFHEGYAVSHGYLICRLCGNRYRLKNMTGGKASCVPIPLRYQVRGNMVQVKVADLKAGRWLF